MAIKMVIRKEMVKSMSQMGATSWIAVVMKVKMKMMTIGKERCKKAKRWTTIKLPTTKITKIILPTIP